MKRLLTPCLAALASSALAYTNVVDGVEWSFTVLDGMSVIYSLVSPVEGRLVVPSALGGRPLRTVSASAFKGAIGLTAVDVPDGVTWIGPDAFAGCSNLVSVSLPDSVTYVGADAFLDCPAALFDTNSIPGVRIVDGWAVGLDPGYAGPVDLSGLRGVAADVFKRNARITSVVLPEGMTTLDHDMFLNCSALGSVTVPEGVTFIGSGTFHNCSSLTSFRVPDSLKSFAAEPFRGCTALSSVSFPYARKNGVDSWKLPEGCEAVFRDPQPFEITTPATLPNVLTDVLSGGFSIEARGGLEPYAWDLGDPSTWSDWPLKDELEWCLDMGQIVFSGTPQEEDIGTHSIVVRVTDAEGHFAERTFSVTVERNPNHGPRIALWSPYSSEVASASGETVSFFVDPRDEDGDVLFLNWRMRAPDGTESRWDGGDRYAFSPTEQGLYKISVSVYDGWLWSEPQAWNLRVGPPASTVESLPDAMVAVDYSHQLETTNSQGTAWWSVDRTPYSVRRETGTYAETGAAVLGPIAGGPSVSETVEVDLPFLFPVDRYAYSCAQVCSDGWLRLGRKVGGVFCRGSGIAACRFVPDADRTNVFVDDSVPGAITFRWDGIEDSSAAGDSEPRTFRFSVTLHSTGSIRLSYGRGNYDATSLFRLLYDVGPSVPGIGTLSGFGDDGMDGAEDIVLEPQEHGDLPDGMHLSDRGLLDGRPSKAGEYSFCLLVQADGQEVRRLFSLSVDANPNRPFVVDSCDPETQVHSAWWSVPVHEERMRPGESRTFSVVAHDPEGRPLSFWWSLDGASVEGLTEGNASSFTFAVPESDFLPAGEGGTGRNHSIYCTISDGVWSDFVEWRVSTWRDWHVDAATTAAVRDGKSWETAFATLQEAAEVAGKGDRVLVRPGVYSPECVSDTGFYDANDQWIAPNKPYAVAFRDVELVGVGAPEATVIDGGGVVSCLRASGGVSGFTLRNGAGHGIVDPSAGCVIRHCIITNCVFRDYLFYACTMENCVVANNRASSVLANGVYFETETRQMLRNCDLHHCTVTENETESDSGCALGYGCEAYNSIVWNNRKAGGAVGNYDERVIVQTFSEWLEEYGVYWDVFTTNRVRVENSCINEFGGETVGLVLSDPLFVDAPRGDFRLRVGSPCLDAGSAERVRGETDLAGNPRVAGSAPDLGALEGATPGDGTLYVDAADGSDQNDGLSRNTPMRSIRRAVEVAEDGGTIVVADGVYEPFDTAGKSLRIESVNGAAAAVVDGGGTNRCAYLGSGVGPGSTLLGFTLRNGSADESIPKEGGSGGGAYGGTLFDCDIVGNRATRTGGGLARSSARRCRIVGNVVEGPGRGDGGGAHGSDLYSCLVASNVVRAGSFPACGGGMCYGTAAQCTIVDNRIQGDGRVCGGGFVSDVSCAGNLFYGNTANGEPSDVDHWSGPVSLEPGCLVGVDPLFVDREHGDYRLLEGSPAVDVGATDVAEWLDPSTTDTDLDGNPRVRGRCIDLGCYESSWTVVRTATVTTPAPVPYSWLDEYRSAAIDANYEAEAASLASNRVNRAWECFVAGLNPNCATNRFTAEIVFDENGSPRIRWTPDLNEGGAKHVRDYVVEGKANLVDKTWGPTNEATRFFRVKVRMP